MTKTLGVASLPPPRWDIHYNFIPTPETESTRVGFLKKVKVLEIIMTFPWIKYWIPIYGGPCPQSNEF